MEKSTKNPPSPSLARRRLLALALTLLIIPFCVVSASAKSIDNSNVATETSGSATVGLITCTSSLFDLQSDVIKTSEDGTSCAKETGTTPELIPGGIPFGIKLQTDGVLIVDTATVEGTDRDPAAEGGLMSGDIIKAINGKAVSSVGEVTKIIETSGASQLTFTVTRNGETKDYVITPIKAPGTETYKAGLWLRDSVAGIGTVTYIDPTSLNFGGLGHGICDAETGSLFPAMKGTVKSVTISGATKGVSGLPGALKGSFGPNKVGKVTANTTSGVFGKFDTLPEGVGKPIATAKAEELHEGDAYILSTVNSDGVKKYNIKISDINFDAENNKNFVITVTDSALIEATGGIVQGMSGSPVIQDGKLVGAVTHVLIANPEKGYGIFIENMLNAAK